MKKSVISTIILLLIGVFSMPTLMAQAPEAMYYQAEARGPHGEAVPNKNLEVKITIRADTPNGAVCWVGFHDVRTDKFGSFNLIIGEGTGGSYDFSAIDWANHSHYLNVKVYYKKTWTDMGTTQFLSVPYALHAKTAERALLDQVEDADADPTNEIQDLSHLALKSNVLALDNTTVFAPDNDYEPATKKYVDERIGGGGITYTVGLNNDLGGYVLYVTPDGKHGLVAATQDQASSSNWYDAPDMISDPSNHNTAGKKFTDWRLPTKYELNLMFSHATALGLGSYILYWSSTRYYVEESWGRAAYEAAWRQHTAGGTQSVAFPTVRNAVRAVRAF